MKNYKAFFINHVRKKLRYPPFDNDDFMFPDDDDDDYVQYDKQKAGLCHRVSCGN